MNLKSLASKTSKWILPLTQAPKTHLPHLLSNALVLQATRETLARIVLLATLGIVLGHILESAFRGCFHATAMATPIPVINKLVAA